MYLENRSSTGPVESHTKAKSRALLEIQHMFSRDTFYFFSWGSLDPSTRWSVVRSAKWPQDHCCKGESFWIQILLNCLYARSIGTSIPFNSYVDFIALSTFSWVIGSINDSSVSGSRNVQYFGHNTNVTKWPCLYHWPQIHGTYRESKHLYHFQNGLYYSIFHEHRRSEFGQSLSEREWYIIKLSKQFH